MSVTADVAQIRAWFEDDGWRREPADLRAALEERGAPIDLIVELLDEGADRRREQPVAQPATNGRGRRRDHASLPTIPDTSLVPPQNLEAEESVLGAAMLSHGKAIGRLRDLISDDGREFYRESHAKIWRAAVDLYDRGNPVDPITLTAELERKGDLEDVGGRVRLHELGALVPASSNAPHYAKIVADCALLRNVIRIGGEVARAGWEGGDVAQVLDSTLSQLRELEFTAEVGNPVELVQAGDAIFDEPTDTDTIRVWGDGEQIAWASGEGLMIVGPDGVGKTTLGQQIALARAGLRADVLGMRVTPSDRRVLYIAADRPRQALRSMRRMVLPSERDELNNRMSIWKGPLPAMLNEDRTILTRLAKQFDADCVVIDSMKDVAVDLAKDESGGRIASTFQHLIAAGVELLVMHHPRKGDTGGYHKPRDLQDTYGSRLIYGVFGSVISLWGEPGDVLIEFRHLKQPIEEVGIGWTLRHDHAHGKTTVEQGGDLLELLLRAGTTGLTVRASAELVHDKDDLTKNQIEKIRQRLEKLVKSDQAVKMPGLGGTSDWRYLFNGPAEAFDR